MTAEMEEYMRSQSRAYLDHVRKLVMAKSGISRQLEDVREGATAIKACSGLPPASPSPDAIPNAVAAIAAVEERYAQAIVECEAERMRADRLIMEIADPACSTVLRLRYLLGMSWHDVCEEMAYTKYGMMKLHSRALLEFYWHVPHEWRDPVHPAI